VTGFALPAPGIFADQHGELRLKGAGLFHAFLAALLFFPLFTGAFAAGGTDLIYNHYPNLLFGYREFHQFGAFSLWNPYIFAGTDFSGSIHAHYLNPLYWPLLALPEAFLFHGLTALFMVMNGLIGFLWSRIAHHLGIKGAAPLLVGLVAQAGMFFWFTMTTMIAVPMYLAASLAVWLLVTYSSRSWLKNYIALSASMAMLIITPHPMYILGFALPVAGFFAVHFYPHWLLRPWRGATPALAAAALTALLFASYRILPVFIEIASRGNAIDSARIVYDAFNAAYFGLTAFNPLSLGISLFDSMDVSAALHGPRGRHAQAHNALYFGVAPLILIYIALRRRPTKGLFALFGIYLALQISYLHVVQPLSDIIYFVFYPVAHEGLFRPAAALTFLFLLVTALLALPVITPEKIRSLAGECLAIGSLFFAGWIAMLARMTYNLSATFEKVSLRAFANACRFSLLAALGLMAVSMPVARRWLRHPAFGLVGIAIALLFLAAAAPALQRYTVLTPDDIAVRPLLSALTVFCACAALLGAIYMRRRDASLIMLALFVAAAILLQALPYDRMLGAGLPYITWVGSIGWATFFALLIAALVVLAQVDRPGFDLNRVMLLLTALATLDLFTAYRNYSYVNVITEPYYRTLNLIYPGQTFASAQMGADSQDNLTLNSGFEFEGGMPANWKFGGAGISLCPPAAPIPMQQGNAVHVCHSENGGMGNLYQDVELPASASQVALGVWVRAEAPMEVRTFLTNPPNKRGGAPASYAGDGKWRWIVTNIAYEGSLKSVRIHLNMAKAGRAEFFAPRLVIGATALPLAFPGDKQTLSADGDSLMEQFDLDDFRANRVHMINKVMGNELMTNFAMVARTPTYAGVDSDLPADFLRFLDQFKRLDPSWFHRAGLHAVMDNERALDLLGVRYDTDRGGSQIIIHPNALPRFSAFSAYEVIPDFSATLARLKAPDFDPTRVLLLDRAPLSAASGGAAPGGPTSPRMQLMHYERPAADTLSLKIDAEAPRHLLFNDRYSPDWNATWNSRPLPMLRANSIFMAVVLPEGPGELVFRFQPALFHRLSLLAAGIGALLALLAAFAYLSPLFRRHKPA